MFIFYFSALSSSLVRSDLLSLLNILFWPRISTVFLFLFSSSSSLNCVCLITKCEFSYRTDWKPWKCMFLERERSSRERKRKKRFSNVRNI